jgi:transcriptional regulator with XRE-family HTH domain
MREKERESARMRLDNELRYYRLAGREKRPTQQLLRRVRQVLGLRSAELAREVGVNRSVLFRLEESEGRGTISLNAMTRVAQAMGCKVVYAVIPKNGPTFQEMVERKKWTKLLAAEEEAVTLDQGTESSEQFSVHWLLNICSHSETETRNFRGRLCVEVWEPLWGLPCTF